MVIPLTIAFTAALFALFVHVYRERRRNVKVMRDLQDRVQRAEHIVRAKAQLANEVAHEIKNPVTAIVCSAETLDLLLKDSLSGENRQALRYIVMYGNQLLRLVGDFLDLNRAELGHIEAAPEPVRIGEALEPIVGLLQAQAMQKQITIESFRTDQNLWVNVDPKHLKQILFNLLHNAVKFTPVGGKVQILILDNFPDDSVTVSVSDTGPGIAVSDLSKLFDAYKISQRKGEVGVGLGLALTRQLVTLAGGAIDVRSQVGKGSSFQVRLRRVPPPKREESVPERTYDDTPLSGQRFLVVEQDDGVRYAVSRLIQAWGGLVDSVTEAKEAVRIIAEGNYDAVMVDQTRDGYSAVDAAKFIRESCQVPIILASSEPVADIDLAHCGADEVVEKPLQSAVLLSTLRNAGRWEVN